MSSKRRYFVERTAEVKGGEWKNRGSVFDVGGKRREGVDRWRCSRCVKSSVKSSGRSEVLPQLFL